jgi:hypothetical protein
MTFHTYENYNENEYFLLFHNIHPILIYSNNEYDKKKKEFQIKLLNDYKDNKISKKQLEINYNLLLNIEKQYKILLNTIEYEHKKIQKNIKENNENLLINYINNLF